MADIGFNISKGRVVYYASLPAANDGLKLILLVTAGLQTDDVLADHDTVAAILAASNDEATFTNYSRITLTNVTITVDDVNNLVDVDCDAVVFNPAGGATNNTMGKGVIAYDPDLGAGDDTSLVPLVAFDIAYTTTGIQWTLTPAAAGFYRAQ